MTSKAKLKKNEHTVPPREVGRAATVVRCQVATPRPPCRCIANVLLRWSAQTAPRRKRAAVRGPRGSRFDAAQWAKREPGGSVRLEGCIQDGSLGYCATERVACAATAPLNVSHPFTAKQQQQRVTTSAWTCLTGATASS